MPELQKPPPDGTLGLNKSDNTVLVYDSHIKTGACILTIDPHGKCSLHKHHHGHVLYAFEQQQKKQASLQFLECSNYSKTKAGMICVVSEEPFDDIKPGESRENVDLALLQGIAICGKKFQIIFHRFIFKSTGGKTMRDVLENHSNDDVVRQLFDMNATAMDANNIDVMYFNQFGGFRHPQWDCNIKVMEYKFDDKAVDGKRRLYYESGLQPDNWGENKYLDPGLKSRYKFMRMESTAPSMVDNLSFARNNGDGKHIVAGKNRSLAVVETEVARVLYCKKIFNGYSIKDHFLQVLPTNREEGYQYLAPLKKDQVRELDRAGVMTIVQFDKMIERFLKDNGKKTIRVKRMVVNDGGRFFVTIVDGEPKNHPSQKKKARRRKKRRKSREATAIKVFATDDDNDHPHIWSQDYRKNFYEYEVEHGFVIAQCFSAIYPRFLLNASISLLLSVLHGPGLKRERTISNIGSGKKRGKFFIFGCRHSCQSDMTMSQRSQNRHHYSDKKSMIISFMPLIIGMVKLLSDIAAKLHLTSGAVMNSIAEKVRMKVKGIKEGNTKMPHWTIVTSNFANSFHLDSRDVTTSYFIEIWEHVMMSGNEKITQYFERFQKFFPDLVRKKQWPLSTTCCWMPMSANSDWIHVEYFVFVDLLLAFDLSSDVFSQKTEQLACTFLGSAFGHLTTNSLYMNGKMVSTVPPPLCNGNFAWGEYSSSSGS